MDTITDQELVDSQRQHWQYIHSNWSDNIINSDHSEFAEEVAKYIKNGDVLELGCGAGSDSIYLAKTGLNITATDFSLLALKKNLKEINLPNLKSQELSISDQMPFKDEEFDGVYARLSLHYFKDAKTKEIFKEIHRILKKEGYIFFMCKSTKDVSYGQGEEIEKDIFLTRRGHVRHLFSLDYTRECLDGLFDIVKIEEKNGILYDSGSTFIECIAKKHV